MLKNKKIGLIGVGLIGGSIAKALKVRGDITVYKAFDTDADTLKRAKKEGYIENICRNIKCLQDCHIIIVSVPVDIITSVIDSLGSGYSGIITDTAGTKGSIIQYVMENYPEMRFVGGHPMAGSDKKGYQASSHNLYENAPYIICESNLGNVSSLEYNIVAGIVDVLGARPIYMDYKEHDKAVGIVSHLPHVIAYALVKELSSYEDDRLGKIAAGGFKDITRIASSDPELWAQILCDSGNTVADLISDFHEELYVFEKLIRSGNRSRLKNYLEKIKNYRDGIQTSTTTMEGFAQIWVDIHDKPGMIATVAQIFAEEGINIRNIAIQDSREYEGGSLRITVSAEGEAELGAKLLKDIGMEPKIIY